jgi:hypothetical protein
MFLADSLRIPVALSYPQVDSSYGVWTERRELPNRPPNDMLILSPDGQLLFLVSVTATSLSLAFMRSVCHCGRRPILCIGYLGQKLCAHKGALFWHPGLFPRSCRHILSGGVILVDFVANSCLYLLKGLSRAVCHERLCAPRFRLAVQSLPSEKNTSRSGHARCAIKVVAR